MPAVVGSYLKKLALSIGVGCEGRECGLYV